MPEIALKGYPRAGAVVLPLLAFGINYAKKILLTADKFGLDDLKNFNFPTRIFPSEELELETWNFVKNFSKHPFHVSSLIKAALTMMDKKIIKNCFELENTCAKAAHEKKDQDEIDSFIKSLYESYSTIFRFRNK
jgi:enoyl-CoA hydratase/carnithine racemase